jgi:hypothetical protein
MEIPTNEGWVGRDVEDANSLFALFSCWETSYCRSSHIQLFIESNRQAEPRNEEHVCYLLQTTGSLVRDDAQNGVRNQSLH